MKKDATIRTLLYGAFAAVLIAAAGCAVTDYGVITDNDDNDTYEPDGFVVDTQGKAFYQECSTIATIWPDGYDELLTWVDQKADGTATITNHNNHTSFGQPWSSDELYCNPDWQGCSIFTAPDDNDLNLFDGRLNANCSGARSLMVLLSTGRYYGECGRVSRLSAEEKLSLIGAAELATRHGTEGLLWDFTGSNTTVTLENDDGERFHAPVVGRVQWWASGDGRNRALIDATDPLLGSTLGWYANFQDRHATETTRVTVCYRQICADTAIAGKNSVGSGARIRAMRNTRF